MWDCRLWKFFEKCWELDIGFVKISLAAWVCFSRPLMNLSKGHPLEEFWGFGMKLGVFLSRLRLVFIYLQFL